MSLLIKVCSIRNNHCGQLHCNNGIPAGDTYYRDMGTLEIFCQKCYEEETLSPDEKAGF